MKMVFDVSNACRSALAEMLSAQAAGWGAAELAVWLAGPYRHATRWAPQSAARVAGSGTPSSSPPPSSEGAVRELLASARHTVRDHIGRLSRGDGAFVRDAMARQFVVSRRDGDSGRIVPVDAYRMRLVDRVESLAAADCLARPRDYTRLILVCTACGAMHFDGRACAHAADAPPISGIYVKEAVGKTG